MAIFLASQHLRLELKSPCAGSAHILGFLAFLCSRASSSVNSRFSFCGDFGRLGASCSSDGSSPAVAHSCRAAAPLRFCLVVAPLRRTQSPRIIRSSAVVVAGRSKNGRTGLDRAYEPGSKAAESGRRPRNVTLEPLTTSLGQRSHVSCFERG